MHAPVTDWGAMLVEERDRVEAIRIAAKAKIARVRKLMGELTPSMKEEIKNQITEKLRALWSKELRTLTDPEIDELRVTFGGKLPARFYFSKWARTDRDLTRPEHHDQEESYYSKGLCGLFRMETEADLTKAVNAHIEYIVRSLYYLNIHPDRHVITGVSMGLGQPAYSRMSAYSYILPTCLHINLKENVDPDNSYQDSYTSHFPPDVYGCVY